MLILAWSVVACVSCLNLWLIWLNIYTYRRLVASDRDRDRLIRRVGQYHSIPLALLDPDARPNSMYPPETPVPAAFRTKRPTPPPGFRKGNEWPPSSAH